MAYASSATSGGRMGLIGIVAFWVYFSLLGSWLVLPLALTIAVVYAVLNGLTILITGDELQIGRTVGTAPAMHQLKLLKYGLFLDSYPGAIPRAEHAA